MRGLRVNRWVRNKVPENRSVATGAHLAEWCRRSPSLEGRGINISSDIFFRGALVFFVVGELQQLEHMITKITGSLVRVLDDEVRLLAGPFEYQVLVPEFVRRRLQGQT